MFRFIHYYQDITINTWLVTREFNFTSDNKESCDYKNKNKENKAASLSTFPSLPEIQGFFSS